MNDFHYCEILQGFHEFVLQEKTQIGDISLLHTYQYCLDIALSRKEEAGNSITEELARCRICFDYAHGCITLFGNEERVQRPFFCLVHETLEKLLKQFKSIYPPCTTYALCICSECGKDANVDTCAWIPMSSIEQAVTKQNAFVLCTTSYLPVRIDLLAPGKVSQNNWQTI